LSQHPSLFSRSDPWLLALLFLGPLVVSLPLLRHDFASTQSIEFTLAAKTLGIVHTPGYPLFLLAAKLFSLFLPMGSDIWRMNFSSLCFTLIAAFFIYLTCRRLHFPPIVSFASGLLLCFSPFFWQASLMARPWAFHLFLITAVIFLTGELLGQTPWPFPKFQISLWSLLAGAAASQHITLMPWAGTAWFIGLVYGFPRQQAKASDYSLASTLAGLGFILPYLYLPFRVTDPRAFWNPDFLYQYATLRIFPSLPKMVTWLAWYLSGGYSSLEFSSGFSSDLMHLGQTLSVFVWDYAFLPLVVVMVGIGLNLQRMVLEPAQKKLDIDPHARVMMALIPAIALGLELLLFPGQTDAIHFTLSLAAVYWIGCGLEYCYYRLGHPQTDVPIPHPAWFGIIVVLVVPLLAGVHSYSLLMHQARRSGPSLMDQTRKYMQALPPHTLVTFGRTDQYFPFLYLQQTERLRPDITLAPPSRMWPKQPYSGPAIIPAFLKSSNLYWHRMLFSQYWMEGLRARIHTGRPTILLLPQAASQTAMDPVLQQLDLTDVGLAWPAWEDDPASLLAALNHRTGSRLVPTYRLQGPAPLPEAEHLPVNEKTLADFGGQWQLLGFNPGQTPATPAVTRTLLKFSLRWQWIRKSAPGRYTVRIQVLPETNANAGKPWEGERRLGESRDLSQLKPGSAFSEAYQLAVPKGLTPGQYRLWVAVENEKQEPLPAKGKSNEAAYFIPVCEIGVLASGTDEPSAP
jgi:hypothetical protein